MIVVRMREKYKTLKLGSASIKYSLCYYNYLLGHLSSSQSYLLSLQLTFYPETCASHPRAPLTNIMADGMPSGGI